LISRAAPKRQYYLQSARGNRLFDLELGPIARAFCAASDPASQRRIDAIVAAEGPGAVAAGLLRDADLGWAAELLTTFPTAPTTQPGDMK